MSRKVLEDKDQKFTVDAHKLLFYGLFKATSGDCKVSAPNPKDWIHRAKYDAWRAQMGSFNMAKEQYIQLLETVAPSLIHEHGNRRSCVHINKFLRYHIIYLNVLEKKHQNCTL